MAVLPAEPVPSQAVTDSSYPGAEAPDRTRIVETPVPISVKEWGDPGAKPLVLGHGGGDFSRTFDVFAPLLAADGWRVVAWDHRGHGDSGRAPMYGWTGDLHDAIAVIVDADAGEPVPVVAHSKSGAMAIELAVARPELFECIVCIDGFTRRQMRQVPLPELAEWWLDRRRTLGPWKPGRVEELAERRKRTNPRLADEWLQYLVTVGAARVGESDLWRWRLDPAAYPGPPHGWPKAWSFELLSKVSVPMLGLKSGIDEEWVGSATWDELQPWFPPHAQTQLVDGVGHFAHIEAPERVAGLVTAFLGSA